MKIINIQLDCFLRSMFLSTPGGPSLFHSSSDLCVILHSSFFLARPYCLLSWLYDFLLFFSLFFICQAFLVFFYLVYATSPTYIVSQMVVLLQLFPI